MVCVRWQISDKESTFLLRVPSVSGEHAEEHTSTQPADYILGDSFRLAHDACMFISTEGLVYSLYTGLFLQGRVVPLKTGLMAAAAWAYCI